MRLTIDSSTNTAWIRRIREALEDLAKLQRPGRYGIRLTIRNGTIQTLTRIEEETSEPTMALVISPEAMLSRLKERVLSVACQHDWYGEAGVEWTTHTRFILHRQQNQPDRI